MPTAQKTHVLALWANLARGHVLHWIAPRASEILWRANSQSSQATLLTKLALYLPIAHAVQDGADGRNEDTVALPMYPALHTHTACEISNALVVL